MTDLFDPPGSGDQFDFKAHNGCLLLIKPLAERLQVPTKDYGPKDAIEAHIHVLDGTDAGEVSKNAYVFPLVLQGQIRGGLSTGRFSLGRLEQGAATKGNPPWRLADPTDADKDLARRYLNSARFKQNEGGGAAPAPQAVPANPPTPSQQGDPWGGASNPQQPAPQQPAAQPPASDPWGGSEPPF